MHVYDTPRYLQSMIPGSFLPLCSTHFIVTDLVYFEHERIPGQDT